MATSVQKSDQRAWNPALFDASATLGEAYRDMPRGPASAVPLVVRMLENPQSRLALPGAIDLFGHDCTHVALGRGLLPQDEAFVLGFTMGTSPKLRPWQVELFKFFARFVYRGDYRFSALDTAVFEHGLGAARASGARDLAAFDYRGYLGRPLGELRGALGLRPEFLTQTYRIERERFPHTHASARLAA